jgi:hypothetical protein
VNRLPQLLLGLVSLAIAIVVAGVVVGGAVRAVKASRDTISVTGSAKQPISADLVQWGLRVNATDPDPGAASRAVAAQARKVHDFLFGGGLSAREVTAEPLATEEVSVRRGGRRVTAYRLTQRFDVSSRRIDAVEALGARLSALLEQGVPVAADPLAYVSTRLRNARLQALAKATANAKERAATIVQGIGGRLGGARRARLGVYQVTPRNSTDVSDYGINDTSSREKDVTAVVTVTFALEG